MKRLNCYILNIQHLQKEKKKQQKENAIIFISITAQTNCFSCHYFLHNDADEKKIPENLSNSLKIHLKKKNKIKTTISNKNKIIKNDP